MATKGGSIQEAAAAAAQVYRNNYWRGGKNNIDKNLSKVET